MKIETKAAPVVVTVKPGQLIDYNGHEEIDPKHGSFRYNYQTGMVSAVAEGSGWLTVVPTSRGRQSVRTLDPEAVLSVLDRDTTYRFTWIAAQLAAGRRYGFGENGEAETALDSCLMSVTEEWSNDAQG